MNNRMDVEGVCITDEINTNVRLSRKDAKTERKLITLVCGV